MNQEEFAQLAAGDALGALSDEDRVVYHRALADHPEWEGLAQQDVDTAASLAELAPEVAPPPGLLGTILARIDEAPGDTPEDTPVAHPGEGTPAPDRRSRLRRRWFALAASLVLLIAVGAGTVLVVQQATRPAATIALERIEAAPDAQQASAEVQGGDSATLHWSPSVGKAVLVTGALPALEDDQTFELWYVRGTTPIAAGTFDATGTATSAVLDPGMEPGDVIAVTVEQSGGSADGVPTTAPILTISTG
ncbi:anti-sigma factor [Microbacterium sp. KUDC0406]|uniref:anti-sigma factor n=1 Tax=Microbacterium sp. KUDC0406 TaxID=2909588 RepID=UPI001F41FF80|nr:anti-sigma factor [Microbacterium sp. KUDC0406]UJP10878.1 anti-sigma factor [Microbacterium sp. KUDC0406]